MEDFFVQECCVHGTDLEYHGPTSILCDDPLPIESNADAVHNTFFEYIQFPLLSKTILFPKNTLYEDFCLKLSKNIFRL